MTTKTVRRKFSKGPAAAVAGWRSGAACFYGIAASEPGAPVVQNMRVAVMLVVAQVSEPLDIVYIMQPLYLHEAHGRRAARREMLMTDAFYDNEYVNIPTANLPYLSTISTVQQAQESRRRA
eukprot:g59027.t1